MADWGLLAGLAEGLRSGTGAYIDAKKRTSEEEDKAAKRKGDKEDRDLRRSVAEREANKDKDTLTREGWTHDENGLLVQTEAAKDRDAFKRVLDAAGLTEKGYKIDKTPDGGYASHMTPEALEDRARKQREQDLKDKLTGADIDYKKSETRKNDRESKGQGNLNKTLSPGQKSADEAFGKESTDYYYSGGKPGVEKNLGLLQEAINKLNKNKDLTGGLTTKIPFLSSDSAQDIINPEMASVRDEVRGAVQSSLKQILGGQFTEKEGQAIFNRSFNPRLSSKENAKRATVELEALKRMAAAKDKAMQHFGAQGTLRGMETTPTNTNGGKAPPNGAQSVFQNGVRYDWNPDTGKYE